MSLLHAAWSCLAARFVSLAAASTTLCTFVSTSGAGHAGHGTRVHDTVGDEPDGMNEAICPCDFKQAGYIVDDEMNRQSSFP